MLVPKQTYKKLVKVDFQGNHRYYKDLVHHPIETANHLYMEYLGFQVPMIFQAQPTLGGPDPRLGVCVGCRCRVDAPEL